MEKETPYFSIGSEELESKSSVGRTAICPACKKKHLVRFGKDTKTGKMSTLLGFVNCKKESYLVSLAGKAL